MKINTSKSKVNFNLKKLFFFTVEGELPEVNGEVNWNESNPETSSIDLSISVKGINTQNAKRDEHLLQEDFFNAALYPTMTFKSESIKKKDNTYSAVGQLTIMDTTKTIEIPFKFENNRATGNFNINRLDYKLGKIPGFVASNYVNISFDFSLN